MNHRTLLLIPAIAALALAAACAREPAEPTVDAGETTNVAAAGPEVAATKPGDAPPPSVAPGQTSPIPSLTEAGFGPHVVGNKIALVGPAPPVEEPRISDECHMYRDPNLPGVWIMTDGEDVVQRVAVLAPSTLETGAGIGIGAGEAAVRAAYPGLRAEPNEHAEAPAKDLYTAPPGEAGLRFDIDGEGKVVEMSGGAPPFLGYSEGCA
jgi:hypothetical protein